MFKWIKKLFSRTPPKPVEPVVEEPIDTSLDGKWLQLKCPDIYEDYVIRDGEYVYDKAGNKKIDRRCCFSMYIKFTQPLYYQRFDVEAIPRKKLIFQEELESITHSSYTNNEDAHYKKTFTDRYELIKDKKLINKLECASTSYHANIEKARVKRVEEFHRIAKAHRCK